MRSFSPANLLPLEPGDSMVLLFSQVELPVSLVR
jgi:hypothetical protein